MSGHSKWHSIKHHKGLADAKKGVLFTKFANAITLAAKQSGGDPEFNFSLRLAIDKAKTSNMPKDRIDRSIKRGTGELGGEQLSEMIYEGFAPYNVAVVVEAVTDNKNRTVSEVKHVFSRHNGALGGPNSVMWMFTRLGIIRIELEGIDLKKEDIELLAIDAGALDIIEDGQTLLICTNPADLKKVRDQLSSHKLDTCNASIEYRPKEKTIVTDAQRESLETFFDALDELADVTDYYTNIDD